MMMVIKQLNIFLFQEKRSLETLHKLLTTSPNDKNHDKYLKITKHENYADESNNRLSSNVIDNDEIKDEFKVEVNNDEVVEVTTIIKRIDDNDNDHFEVGDETVNHEPEMPHDKKVIVNKKKSNKDKENVKTKKSKKKKPVPGSETIKKGTAEPQ